MTTLINSIYEQYLTKKYAKEIKEFQDVVGGILNEHLQERKNFIFNMALRGSNNDLNALKESYKEDESMLRKLINKPLQFEKVGYEFGGDVSKINKAYEKLQHLIVDGEINGNSCSNCEYCIPEDIEISVSGIEAFDLDKFAQELTKHLFNNK